jgi:hypothetical protein
MPLQIDEVQAEMVAQPKPEIATPSTATKSTQDLRGVFERMQQRQLRLKAD